MAALTVFCFVVGLVLGWCIWSLLTGSPLLRRTHPGGCSDGIPVGPPTGGGPTSSADPRGRGDGPEGRRGSDPECPALCDSGEEPGPGFQPDPKEPHARQRAAVGWGPCEVCGHPAARHDLCSDEPPANGWLDDIEPCEVEGCDCSQYLGLNSGATL